MKKISSHPRPLDIKEVRKEAKITQPEAAALVHADIRTWQRWESGEIKMHPGMWELFKIKVKNLGE